MDKLKMPNPRRLAIVVGLFIILSIAFLFWARDFIREVFVLPISYLFWLIGVLVDATPQIFFWLALLVIAFRIASLSVSRKRVEYPAAPAAHLEEDDYPSTGRVEYWAGKVNLLRSGRGSFYSRSFHGALSHALMDLLAYRCRRSPRQVEDGLRDGSLDVPEDIRQYALENLRPIEPGSGSFFGEMWSWIKTSARNTYYRILEAFQARGYSAPNRARPRPGAIPGDDAAEDEAFAARQSALAAHDDPQVIRILRYMEEELEVLHDDTGH